VDSRRFRPGSGLSRETSVTYVCSWIVADRRAFHHRSSGGYILGAGRNAERRERPQSPRRALIKLDASRERVMEQNERFEQGPGTTCSQAR